MQRRRVLAAARIEAMRSGTPRYVLRESGAFTSSSELGEGDLVTDLIRPCGSTHPVELEHTFKRRKA